MSVGKPGNGAVVTSSGCGAARRIRHARRCSVGLDLGAALAQLVEHRLAVSAGSTPRTRTSPPVVDRGREQRARLDPVAGSPRCRTPRSSRRPRSRCGRCPRRRSRRPSCWSTCGELDDLGLARGVLDHRLALGEARRHHHVLGCRSRCSRSNVTRPPRARAARAPRRSRGRARSSRRARAGPSGADRPGARRSRSRRARTRARCRSARAAAPARGTRRASS